MTTSIAIITLPDASAASAAFAAARDLHAVRGAVVVARDEQGRIEVVHGTQPPEDKTIKGGMLGGLVGTLGGPLGTLLGWTTGSIIGQTADTTSYDNAIDGIAVLSDRITPGTSALIVEIDDDNRTSLDTALHLNVEILRIPAEHVPAEVAVALRQIDEADNVARGARRTAGEIRRAGAARFPLRHDHLRIPSAAKAASGPHLHDRIDAWFRRLLPAETGTENFIDHVIDPAPSER